MVADDELKCGDVGDDVMQSSINETKQYTVIYRQQFHTCIHVYHPRCNITGQWRILGAIWRWSPLEVKKIVLIFNVKIMINFEHFRKRTDELYPRLPFSDF